MQPLDWGNQAFDYRLVRDMKLAEGLRLKAYKDTLGFWTVGYGHKLPDAQDGDHEWEGYVITNEQADAWFMEDLKKARTSALGLPHMVGVCGQRVNAIIELVFNMGLTHLLDFRKMWAAWKAQDFETAAKELLDSKWAAQVGPARSRRIAELIMTGCYPE